MERIMDNSPVVGEELKRFELWIGFFKFSIGTVILGLVSTCLNHQYQNNQLALEREKSENAIALQEKQAEFEYLNKFINHAMSEDLEVRIRLAEYMQSAALSKNIKEIWRQYYDVLIERQAEILEKREKLKKEEEKIAQNLVNIKESNEDERHRQIQEISNIQKEILYLQDQLDRRKYGSFEENYVDIYEIYRKARLARSEGNYSQALAILKKGLTSESGSLNSALFSEIAMTCRAMRDFKCAEKYAKRATTTSPKDAKNLYRLAIMQKNNNQIDLAVTTLLEAEKLSQGELKLNIQLVIAGYLIHAGNRKEGMKKFGSIQKQVEKNSSLAVNLAWFRAVAGPKEEFYNVFERALSLDRDGSIFQWIDMETDLDPYRQDAKFVNLVEQFKPK